MDYGDLRIINIIVAMPIGDDYAWPHLRDALTEYIRQRDTGALDDRHAEIKLPDGCIMYVSHAHPATTAALLGDRS